MTSRHPDEELLSRLQLGEDNDWEFKAVEFHDDQPTSPQRRAWADEIVAFANARGGVLLLGVSDDGGIPGMSRGQLDAVERAVGEICRDSVTPEIHVEIERRLVDGRAFILVDVPEGHALHEHRGQSYIRVGSSKRPLSSDDRMRIAQRRGQARFQSFDQQPVANTGLSTLDARLWRPLLSAESIAEPEIALEKLGLLRTDERGRTQATVAGVLLCTERPDQLLPQAAISAVRFRGDDPSSGQIDAQEITGPLDAQIRDAVTFASRNMRVSAIKTPAREDLPEYSQRAIFEAIVNAVAHRDYSIRGSRIRLRMFSDRLEICSPGSLPNSLTIESMIERQSTRNEILTSMFGRMDANGLEAAAGRRYFMERRGDGVPIINSETQALTGQQPEYRLIDNAELCLTIPSAEPASGPASVVVTVRCEGEPCEAATVLVLFPNSTWKSAATDAHGEARLDLHAVNLPLTVFAAAPHHSAYVEREWLPTERALAIELSPLTDGGSVVFPEAAGGIPGLSGRLNPIRDTHNRTYLYASNIAINGGAPQPVTFEPNVDELHLIDADGREATVRIVAIVGQSSLIEYRSPDGGM